MKGKSKHTPIKDGFAKASGSGKHAPLKDGVKILKAGVIAKGHRDVMDIDLGNFGELGKSKGKGKNVLDFSF